MLSNKTEYPNVLKYDINFKITSTTNILHEKSINHFLNQIFEELNKDKELSEIASNCETSFEDIKTNFGEIIHISKPPKRPINIAR